MVATLPAALPARTGEEDGMNTQEMEKWVHQAIDASRAEGYRLIQSGNQEMGAAALSFAEDLTGAVKFFVPDRSINDGRRVSILKRDAPLEQFADLIGSPYPVWSVVYRTNGEEGYADHRVLLVRDAGSHLSVEVAGRVRRQSPSLDGQEWMYLAGAAHFKKQDPTIFEAIPGGRNLSIMFHWPSSQNAPSNRDLSEMAQEAITDCFVVVETLILLGIENGVKREVKQNDSVNRRRATKGKRRLFDYWVLDVPGDPAAADGPASGSHASPRFHLRRGHLRRLSSGAATWVRATTVGKASGGVVAKDYSVRAPQ